MKNKIFQNRKSYKKWWIIGLVFLGLFIVLMIIGNIVGKGQPMFKNIKSSVYETPITIEGYNVDANAKVDILLNDKQVITVNADKEGRFLVLLDLTEGQNTFRASTITSEGKSKTSVIKKIEYIIKAPNFEILEPVNNSEVENSTIAIKGRTDKNTKIEVQGNEVVVSKDGNFEKIIILSVGENQIIIVADNGKKKTEQIIKIKLLSQQEIADREGEIRRQEEEDRQQEEERKAEEEKVKQQEEEIKRQEEETIKKQGEEKQALIEARNTFDSNRGSNYEAASTAQGFIDIFEMTVPDVGIDMYLNLMTSDDSEVMYKNGGDLGEYRNQVNGAFLTVVINNLFWNLSTDSSKKDIVASWVNSLHILYPNGVNSVTVKNSVRTVAEGKWSLWNGEPKVELK